MKSISISTENNETYSAISNFFIDYYMTEANGDYVKVYLYLVRLLNLEKNITVSQIADHFNLTENDICRAIKYWIGRDAIRLNYDGEGRPSGIVLLPLKSYYGSEKREADIVRVRELTVSEEAEAEKIISDKKPEPAKKVEAKTTYTKSERVLPEKTPITRDDLNDLLHDEDFSSLIYMLQELFAKPITQRDQETLSYIYDKLNFDVDLIEFLIEYCVTMGKKNSRYMEAVAVAWYNEGITSKEEAKAQTDMTTGLVKSLYKQLGIRSRYPTNIEMNYIDVWTKQYGFTDEMVEYAAELAVAEKPASANFKYINGIMENWYKKGVKTKADVERVNKEFAESKAKKAAEAKMGKTSVGSINDFMHSDNEAELKEMEKLFLAQSGNRKESS
ncbi:MAG: DnaD domain protein [Lachnospiraceae bacterium]|nr:DnaD domain protein [Lachnospiraceae bacterium]